MIKLNNNSETCPHCGTNLVAGEISESNKPSFGGRTHFLRIIEIERLGDDYVSSYQCPDCGAEDSRFTENKTK